MRKKKAFTLLEVLIALSLTGVLLGTLFGVYTFYAKKNIELQKQKTEILQRQTLQLRLSQVFGNLGTTFYTHDGLCLTYDNSIDKDPKFSGELKAKLYLEKEKLYFTSWADEKLFRTEILLSHVHKLEILFFNTKTSHWDINWPKENDLPPMIKIIADSIPYAFFFPEAESPPTYTE